MLPGLGQLIHALVAFASFPSIAILALILFFRQHKECLYYAGEQSIRFRLLRHQHISLSVLRLTGSILR